jgi:hypothetical protein
MGLQVLCGSVVPKFVQKNAASTVKTKIIVQKHRFRLLISKNQKDSFLYKGYYIFYQPFV